MSGIFVPMWRNSSLKQIAAGRIGHIWPSNLCTWLLRRMGDEPSWNSGDRDPPRARKEAKQRNRGSIIRGRSWPGSQPLRAARLEVLVRRPDCRPALEQCVRIHLPSLASPPSAKLVCQRTPWSPHACRDTGRAGARFARPPSFSHRAALCEQRNCGNCLRPHTGIQGRARYIRRLDGLPGCRRGNPLAHPHGRMASAGFALRSRLSHESSRNSEHSIQCLSPVLWFSLWEYRIRHECHCDAAINPRSSATRKQSIAFGKVTSGRRGSLMTKATDKQTEVW